jgi:hypothetical protein
MLVGIIEYMAGCIYWTSVLRLAHESVVSDLLYGALKFLLLHSPAELSAHNNVIEFSGSIEPRVFKAPPAQCVLNEESY